jgi:hypothetical protein
MALTFISSQTASASSSLSFTSGIDSTYDAYEFHCVNIHPSGAYFNFAFQVNAVGQSGFNETMTTTSTWAYHRENGFASGLQSGGANQSQGTAYQSLALAQTNNPDDSASGILRLYAPSSTTYVKQFVSDFNNIYAYDYCSRLMVAGYINTTSAIDEIDFKMISGNIDAGTIYMYGVS